MCALNVETDLLHGPRAVWSQLFFMHDRQIVARHDLVRGQDAVLADDLEDCDRDEGRGRAGRRGIVRGQDRATCERLHPGAGQFPLDDSSKAAASGAITAKATNEAAAAC